MVKWWMWLFFAYACLTMIFGFADQVAGSTTNISNLNILMQFNLLNFKDLNVIFTTIPVPLPNLDWFGAFGAVLVWDFPNIFYGNWNMFRVLVLGSISFGATIAFVTEVGPLLANILAGLRSLILRFTLP